MVAVTHSHGTLRMHSQEDSHLMLVIQWCMAIMLIDTGLSKEAVGGEMTGVTMLCWSYTK